MFLHQQNIHLPLFHFIQTPGRANYIALASLCLTNWTVNPCADPFIFPHGSQRLIYLQWWRCASAKSNPVNHRPLPRRFHHFINLRYHYGHWWHNSEQWYTLKILICTLQQRASLSLADLATADLHWVGKPGWFGFCHWKITSCQSFTPL